MSQMNPKKVFHNTAYSVQLPYIAFKCVQIYQVESTGYHRQKKGEESPWKNSKMAGPFRKIYF